MPSTIKGASPTSFTPSDGGDGWSLSPSESEPYLDTEALQQKIDSFNQKYGSLRVHRASFRAPRDCSEGQRSSVEREAITKWLHVMEQKGFKLESKCHIRGPYETYATSGDWYNVPLLDQVEYRVHAAFSQRNAQTFRMELPVAVVKPE